MIPVESDMFFGRENEMRRIEAIQTLAEEKQIPKSTFNKFHHLMQQEEKLIFLFCGTHKLEEMSTG